MKHVTIKKAENGFVLTVPPSNLTPPPVAAHDYVFLDWGSVTTFLEEGEFLQTKSPQE